MRHVKPEVFLVSRPAVDWETINQYLKGVGGESWADRQGFRTNDGEDFNGEVLVELGGRLCYRSFEIGLNPNISRIREDSKEYLGNVLSSGHGSVIEHANYSFVFHNVSRVFTHEMVRHRAGVALSQESMRFVRLTDIPFWFPEWAKQDEELMERCVHLLGFLEGHQLWMADHFGLDDTKSCRSCGGTGDEEEILYSVIGDPPAREIVRCPTCNGTGEVSAVPFSEKKAKTSFMRRFAPDGVATGILVTLNVRALRHIIYMRTALGAEEEIRLVFDEVAKIMKEECPNLMQDFDPNEDREWIPLWPKV